MAHFSTMRCTGCGAKHTVAFQEFNKEVTVKCHKEKCGYENVYCMKGPISKIQPRTLQLV